MNQLAQPPSRPFQGAATRGYTERHETCWRRNLVEAWPGFANI